MKKNCFKYLLLVTCLSCVLIGCDNTKDKPQTFSNNEEETAVEEIVEQQTEEPEESVEQSLIEDVEEENAVGVYDIALNGVLFHIPKTFNITIDEESIFINDEDYNFEIIMVVGDDSYKEALKDKQGLTENARKQDITITKDVTEYQTNGKSYAYFTFNFHEYDTVNTVVYTEGAGDKKIGINMIINSDMTEEEVIDLMDVFLHDTEETELPDTTQSELDDMSYGSNGEVLEKTELNLEDEIFEVKVPEGYFYLDYYSSDTSYRQSFESQNKEVSVNIHIFAKDSYDDALVYVEDEVNRVDLNNSDYSNVETSEIEKVEVKGNTFYYGSVSYDYDEEHYKRFCAACLLPDGEFYALNAVTLSDEELSMDVLGDFMDIQKCE